MGPGQVGGGPNPDRVFKFLVFQDKRGPIPPCPSVSEDRESHPQEGKSGWRGGHCAGAQAPKPPSPEGKPQRSGGV